jgi:transposase-like protein
MPFQEIKKMDMRKQMVIRVSVGELNVSQAAREYGVSRNTVKLWLSGHRRRTLRISRSFPASRTV